MSSHRLNRLPGFLPGRTPFLAGFAFAIGVCLAGNSVAADTEVFQQRIQPLLKQHCYECHSHGSARIKGGLVLDSVEAMKTGGDTGPAIVPGHPEKSLLVQAVHQTGELKMPKKGEKLSSAEIAMIEAWIKDGAPAPASNNIAAAPSKRTGKISDDDRQWWAYQRVANPKPPSVKQSSWPRNEVDQFILARLETEGLAPAPEASRQALIRRLYFDLWGLPPSPEEVNAFVSDSSADAYEKLIDRLLGSRHYGERWARHWLDLVRYADSDGYRIDDYRPNAWRYRDYVVNAFNSDKPYDRFVLEQLAGDELFPDNPEAMTATGYLTHWIYEYNSRDAEGQWKLILNDITDTTGDVFLGAGMQCAQCHDHKFDPILRKDYYALQAFFAPIKPYASFTAASNKQKVQHAAKMKDWEAKTADIRKQIDDIEQKHKARAAKSAIEKFNEEIQAMIHKPESERTPYEEQIADLALRQVTYEYNRLDKNIKGEEKDKLLALRKKLSEFDKLKPEPLPIVMAATDVGAKAPPTFIPKKKDEPIEPAYLTVLGLPTPEIKPPAGIPNSTGRRSTLAKWLVQPDNPLTARVIVNRVWQYHFGRGLSANASDFGKLGEKPSHPELLDWLAFHFMQDGWSIKRLHKLILMSASYREGVTHPSPDSAKLKDPENRLLWRGNVRRLEAEQIRDALYTVSGELKLDPGGPGSTYNEARRSIYSRIMRNNRDPLIDVFDAPFWFSSASSRDVTTTPVQSLLLINSQFMLQRSRALAARLEKEGSTDDERQIERAYQLAFGRRPSREETASAVGFLHSQRNRIDVKEAGSAKAAFLYDKIPYRDGQAAMISLTGPQTGFQTIDKPGLIPEGDFTIESYVLLRSVDESAGVRTVAAKWSGKGGEPGWGFGVTGKKSRRKPQTLVLQMYGKKPDGSFGEEALFSDQNIQLNKPYYLACAVKLARDGKPGEATFYVKDLSNDDEPLLIAKLPVKTAGGFASKLPFTIGGRGQRGGNFDGLIDDVRLSDTALDVDALLFTNERLSKNTIGYWQFEAKPDVFRDASGHGLDIKPGATLAKGKVDPTKAALQDFCHVLLNSNEFLYVE